MPNIWQDMTNMDLFMLCKQFGEVIKVDIAIDRHTGRTRGFGFVCFADKDAAERAIAGLNGLSCGGKRLKVQHKRRQALSAPNDR
jgi:RNA recognition motif-containing protein